MTVFGETVEFMKLSLGNICYPHQVRHNLHNVCYLVVVTSNNRCLVIKQNQRRGKLCQILNSKSSFLDDATAASYLLLEKTPR